jgi:hypothetical protein
MWGVGTCILYCFGFIILAHPARSPDGGFVFDSPPPKKKISSHDMNPRGFTLIFECTKDKLNYSNMKTTPNYRHCPMAKAGIIIIFMLLGSAAHAQLSGDYTENILGFVETGKYYDTQTGEMVGDVSNILSGEKIVWYFNAIHDPGEYTLKLCCYNFELKEYTRIIKIDVSRDGALGTITPEPGIWRFDIMNSNFEILARSKIIIVDDFKKL